MKDENHKSTLYSCFLSLSTHLVRLTERKKPDNQSIIRVYWYPDPGRTGMEVNPLVFETSASTDSAIWASL